MNAAIWIASKLVAGEAVRHSSGVYAYVRTIEGRVTGYVVQDAKGCRRTFPTPLAAALDAADRSV